MIVRQRPRSFVEKVDFVTSVGYGDGPGDRERLGLRGAGRSRVITDLGVLEPDPESLRARRSPPCTPASTPTQAREATGWDLAVADDLQASEEPTAEELDALRELAIGAARMSEALHPRRGAHAVRALRRARSPACARTTSRRTS